MVPWTDVPAWKGRIMVPIVMLFIKFRTKIPSELFIRNSELKREDRPSYKALIPAELGYALFLIIKTIQFSERSPEIKQLREGKDVDKKSSTIL